MSKTLLFRETFSGIGTLNSGTPGNLGTVSGSFFKRPVGPKVSGDTTASGLGWSADFHHAGCYHNWNIASGLNANFNGMVCGWFYFGAIQSDGVEARRIQFLGVEYVSTAVLAEMKCDVNFKLKAVVNGVESAEFQLVPGTWYYMAIAWTYTPATFDTCEYRTYIMPKGGVLTTLVSAAAGGMQAGVLVWGGCRGGGNLGVQARYGCPTLYRIDSFSDATVPTDISDPPAGPFNWYVNPATGSDTNDGTSAITAWQSIDKVNTEGLYFGMFPCSTGYANGDTLYINCSGAPFVVGVTPFLINTRGLNVVQSGGAIDAMRTLPSGGWTTVGGGVYSTTDSSATDLLSIIVREDGKYMAHPTGANYAAVAASLASTAGSFWTDGTTIWIHPFGSTNPASDGKVYRRTRNRSTGGADGQSIVVVQAFDNHYDGLIVSGSTLTTKDTDDPVGSYCFQWNSGAGGNNLLENFSVDHYSKHGVGWTADSIGATCERRNGTYGQRGPWAPGGATSDVDFSGSGTSAGNYFIYRRCTEGNNVGVIGSTTGTKNHGVESYTSHANSVFSAQTSFIDCDWVGAINEQGITSLMLLQRTRCASAGGNSNLTAEFSTSTHGVIGATGGGITTLRNCLIVPGAITGFFFGYLSTTAIIDGCVIDFRGNPSGAGETRAAWRKASGISSATITRSTLIVDDSADFTLLLDYTNADTVSMSGNTYKTGSGNYVMSGYNDGSTTAPRTFAQWQTLGKDADSSKITTDVSAVGAPCLVFDGVDDKYDFSNVALTGDFDIWFVGADSKLGQKLPIAGDNGHSFCGRFAGGFLVQGSSGASMHNTYEGNRSGVVLVRCWRSGSIISVRATGHATTTQTINIGTLTLNRIGNRGIYDFLVNRLAEVQIFNRTLSSGEAGQMETYFAGQYGVGF